MLPISQPKRKRAMLDSMQAASTWRLLRIKANILGITQEELRSCHSVDELKRLARQKFIAIARPMHPDNIHNNKSEQTANRWTATTKGGEKKEYIGGSGFKRLYKVYDWFKTLDEKAYRRAICSRSTVPDPEMPLDWSGWHQQDSFYREYRVTYWP